MFKRALLSVVFMSITATLLASYDISFKSIYEVDQPLTRQISVLELQRGELAIVTRTEGSVLQILDSAGKVRTTHESASRFGAMSELVDGTLAILTAAGEVRFFSTQGKLKAKTAVTVGFYGTRLFAQKNGNLMVLGDHPSSRKMQLYVLSPSGEVLKSVTTSYRPVRSFFYEDRLYVCTYEQNPPRKYELVVVGTDGTVQNNWPLERLCQIRGVSRDGLLVSGIYQHVDLFKMDGQPVSHFSVPNSRDIKLLNDDTVIVAGTHRDGHLYKYNLSGKFLAKKRLGTVINNPKVLRDGTIAVEVVDGSKREHRFIVTLDQELNTLGKFNLKANSSDTLSSDASEEDVLFYHIQRRDNGIRLIVLDTGANAIFDGVVKVFGTYGSLVEIPKGNQFLLPGFKKKLTGGAKVLLVSLEK